MQRIIYILILLLPLAVSAQQPWFKSFPLDYMWKNVGNTGFVANNAGWISFAFNPSDGQPYIAFDEIGRAHV